MTVNTPAGTTAPVPEPAASPPTTSTEPTFEQLALRVDAAAKAVAELADGPARAAAEELKAAVEAVHRAGLVTIVKRMRTDPAARELLFELVDDPVVHLLLSLHGIVRSDPTTLADRVRPNEPAPVLIPAESLWARPGAAVAETWAKAAPVEQLAADSINPLSLTSGSGRVVDVIVVNLKQRMTAYQNACAHEGMPLDNALLDFDNDTLTCPWHGYCYDALSGECLSAPGAQLEQLPLRIDAGHVWIRIGT